MRKQCKNEVVKRQIKLKIALEREFILTSRVYPLENKPKTDKDDQNTEKIKTQGVLNLIPINTQNYDNG